MILSFVKDEFELLEEIDFQTDHYECFRKPATEESTVSAHTETPSQPHSNISDYKHYKKKPQR